MLTSRARRLAAHELARLFVKDVTPQVFDDAGFVKAGARPHESWWCVWWPKLVLVSEPHACWPRM
eukprot:CAMPEP_0119116306 /NCGR_PEP_ID=MMETSP1180-20130426/52214_1 /TAXON_ID=3052 ORGANISM="Chlamydomonas cf sp, Strain CCMP681" /NCGR_SAMPLE_ID=MMETSP1180 /ASSEMBLY_ACC=CAM_ASM_000741 /LENGTH=64 /DNA_ID=CAMNT_0007105439 /DNA_START=827 /DNA_END=1021 /DNA_ORIENTATION=+